MKLHRFVAVIPTLLCCIGYAAATDDVDTRRLTLVEENHATITVGKIGYSLDSYIVMFQQPYYVKVKRDDNRPMQEDEAVKVAKEYIQPRGCTQPLSRRTELDRFNGDKSQWLIGILC